MKLTTLFVLIQITSFGQCVADVCEDAVPFDLCGTMPSDVICFNQTLCNFSCTDENGGDPVGCSSSTSTELDFWIELNVCQDWIYTIRFESNYTSPSFPNLSGAQMWIYDNCFDLAMIETATCDGEVVQDLFIDVYLESGQYYLQIDGFGNSMGCGQLCIYNQGFLGTNIDEVMRNRIKLSTFKAGNYDNAGRRIR